MRLGALRAFSKSNFLVLVEVLFIISIFATRPRNQKYQEDLTASSTPLSRRTIFNLCVYSNPPYDASMKKIITLISLSLLVVFTGCTKMGIKNRALSLSIEKFDSDAQTAAKTVFVDQEQQKLFADVIKKNTQIDVDNIEMQGDNEATARLLISSFSKSIYPELSTISGKDWQAKIDSAKEVKTYTLKLQKLDGKWQITEEKEITAP